MRLSSLDMLVFSGNLIQLPVPDEPCAGLVVAEAGTIPYALKVHVQHPGIITDPGFRTGFTYTVRHKMHTILLHYKKAALF